MSRQQLVLFLASETLTSDTVVRWWLMAGEGELMQAGEQPLRRLAVAIGDALQGTLVTLLVPGEHVLLTSVRIPSRQLRQIKQALPYMVEELIADNIEEVHLALPDGQIVADEPLPVAVIRHTLLIQWLDQFYSHGIEVGAIVPDTLAVPWRQGTATFFVAAERVLYRADRFAGHAFAATQTEFQLDLVAGAQGATELRRCEVIGARADLARIEALVQALEERGNGPVEKTVYEEPAAELLALTAVRRREDTINLRQGGYRVQASGDSGRGWRAVAAVAGAGLLLYGTVAAANGIWFGWQADRMRDESVALYRELFPSDRRVVSPQRQMANHLRAQGIAGASPLPLLAGLAENLEVDGIAIEEVRINRGGTAAQLQLRARSLDLLSQVQQQLRAAGFDADISSAAEQDGQTVGRLQIDGGAT